MAKIVFKQIQEIPAKEIIGYMFLKKPSIIPAYIVLYRQEFAFKKIFSLENIKIEQYT
ncbi:MAG: hypothetical protein ACQPRJ_05870 [Solitalea-like symbiont of Acarus siro]